MTTCTTHTHTHPQQILARPSDVFFNRDNHIAVGTDLSTAPLTKIRDNTEKFCQIQGTQPILAHIPHAGLHSVQDEALKMCPEAFQKNALALTDWMTDDLFDVLYQSPTPECDNPLRQGLGGSAIINRINRFYFDPERYADRAKESMEKIGMGVFYRNGCDNETLRSEIDNDTYEKLLDIYYHPYHNGLAQLARDIYAQHGEIMLVDCHSYPSTKLPYEGEKFGPRPDICLGINNLDSGQALVEFWRQACGNAGLSFAVNTPFSGALVPDTVSDESHTIGFMLEINRHTYLDDGRFISNKYPRLKQFLSKTLRHCFTNRKTLYKKS